MLSSKLVNAAFAATFIASGVLGFVPNPVVAPEGVFAVNIWHNLVHVITGMVFALGTVASDRTGVRIVRGVSLFYIAVAALGFVTSGDMLLGFIHVNQADRWLHLGLAVVITIVGFGLLLNRRSSEATHA